MDADSRDKRFWATLERIRSGEGIVALFLGGEWQCAGLVQVRRDEALYDAAYLAASRSAAIHGGTLDRFAETGK